MGASWNHVLDELAH